MELRRTETSGRIGNWILRE